MKEIYIVKGPTYYNRKNMLNPRYEPHEVLTKLQMNELAYIACFQNKQPTNVNLQLGRPNFDRNLSTNLQSYYIQGELGPRKNWRWCDENAVDHKNEEKRKQRSVLDGNDSKNRSDFDLEEQVFVLSPSSSICLVLDSYTIPWNMQKESPNNLTHQFSLAKCRSNTNRQHRSTSEV